MKSLKYKILFVILFMTIGIAAVTTNLITNGSTNIASNPDDFNVYFSDYFDSGDNNDRFVDAVISVFSSKEISFTGIFQNVGDESNILIEVTNGSKNYDANISFNCSSDSPYLQVYNNIEDYVIAATNSSVAIIQVILIKSYVGDSNLEEEITCTLDASAVERTSQGVGEINIPLEKRFDVGNEISIGKEKFNIISENNDGTITMLAQYNVAEGDDYKQTEEQMWSFFSEEFDWEYTPGPKEVDIQVWGKNVKTVLNNYVSYLNNQFNIDSTGDLITLKQLKDLGCTVPDDYDYGDGGWTCNGSSYKDWLINGQYWWTRSTPSGDEGLVWYVSEDATVMYEIYYFGLGVRPTITVSKETAYYLMEKYPVGNEVSIGTEKFNVISDNGLTVSLLAQKNINEVAPYNQTEENVIVLFSDDIGWEYTPGPKDIDIDVWSPYVSNLINKYENYLKKEYAIQVTGDLITLSELGELGCSVPSDYAWSEGEWYCHDSLYADWLLNGQMWWTCSSISDLEAYIWMLSDDGYFELADFFMYSGVRPVITVNKKDLNR